MDTKMGGAQAKPEPMHSPIQKVPVQVVSAKTADFQPGRDKDVGSHSPIAK